jgi:hypothetical protein
VRDALRTVATMLLCLAAACASQNGPKYPDFAASAPPIALGHARLVVYRMLFTPPQEFHAQITVDGAPVGSLPTGTYLWVDQPAGLHRLDSPLWPAYSAFGEQLRTAPVEVELASGTTSFVSVSLLTTDPLRVSLALVSAGQARRDLETLEMAPPAPVATTPVASFEVASGS